MLESHQSKMLGALVTLGVIIGSATGVSAAAMSPPIVPAIAPSASAAENLFQEAKVNITIGIGQKYDRNRHGRRCSFRQQNCNNYYNGYYYQNQWWMVPGFDGGHVMQHDYGNHRYARNHVRWCQERYRSYNVRTNTWLSNSGEYRQCYSPY